MAASFIIASFQFHYGKNLYTCGIPDGEALTFSSAKLSSVNPGRIVVDDDSNSSEKERHNR
jgi:hypothetical protein